MKILLFSFCLKRNECWHNLWFREIKKVRTKSHHALFRGEFVAKEPLPASFSAQNQKSLQSLSLLVFCRQHSSWTGGQPGPAGGDHWLPDSATFLRPRIPLVFPQASCYSWRGNGNRVRLCLLSPSHPHHVRASSCNYELKAEGVTFSKCLSVVAVFG